MLLHNAGIDWQRDVAIVWLPHLNTAVLEQIDVIAGCLEAGTRSRLIDRPGGTEVIFEVGGEAKRQNTWRRFIQANHLLLSIVAIRGYQKRGRGVVGIMHPNFEALIRGAFRQPRDPVPAIAKYYPFDFFQMMHPDISIVSPGNLIAGIKAELYDPDTAMVVFLLDVKTAPRYLASPSLDERAHAATLNTLTQLTQGGVEALQSMWSFGQPCQ